MSGARGKRVKSEEWSVNRFAIDREWSPREARRALVGNRQKRFPESPKAISALTQYDCINLGLAVSFLIIQIRLGEFVPLSPPAPTAREETTLHSPLSTLNSPLSTLNLLYAPDRVHHVVGELGAGRSGVASGYRVLLLLEHTDVERAFELVGFGLTTDVRQKQHRRAEH